MARLRDPHREHYWRQHHLRQRTSGLSIGDYCTRECISAAAFYAWRKRLAPLLPALPEPPLFVPVNLSSATGSAGTLPCHKIEIEVSHYVRLRLDSLPEPEWLCRVTAGLTSLLSKEAIS